MNAHLNEHLLHLLHLLHRLLRRLRLQVLPRRYLNNAGISRREAGSFKLADFRNLGSFLKLTGFLRLAGFLKLAGCHKLAGFLSYFKLLGAYLRFNFKSNLEYRGAFASQVLSMIINDCFWLAFWLFFFKRFPVLGAWGSEDVVAMWAIAATGFGIAHGIAGNASQLASIILKGQLDTWLLYPRNSLAHLLLGRMHVSAWGDVIFGVLSYLFIVHPSLESLALFSLLVLSSALVILGFDILVGSLGFFLGNSEGLAEHLRFALLTFSTYPSSIFDNAGKLLLFTLIPAAYATHLPVEALRTHSLSLALLSLAGSAAVFSAGVFVFRLGLRKYESGNLMEMRG